jgi:hypothetical protein
MAPCSVWELARQVVEAYSAAVPQSTMPRTQEQAHTQAQIVVKYAQRPCTHPISTFLASKLPDIHFCPTCTINNNIGVVQDVHEQFAEHGGTFASREKAHHKALRKIWQDAKLVLINTVTLFETLKALSYIPAEDKLMVTAALDIWNESKAALSKIPGVQYEWGIYSDPTKEDHETARLMIDLLKLILAKEMTAEDKEYHQHEVHWKIPTSP